MTRAITSDFYTQATSRVSSPVYLFEGFFSESQIIRLWNGIANIDWDSKTWNGNGQLHGIYPATEDENINANGVQVELAGVPSNLISLVLRNAKVGYLGKVWLSFLNSDNVLVDPYLLFEGKFDYAEIIHSATKPSIVLYYESELIEMERSKEYRFNSATQRLFFPEDRGFEYVESLQDKKLQWGKEKVENIAVIAKTPVKITKQKPKAKDKNKNKTPAKRKR